MSDLLKNNKRTELNKRPPLTDEEIKWVEIKTYVLKIVKIVYKRDGKIQKTDQINDQRWMMA